MPNIPLKKYALWVTWKPSPRQIQDLSLPLADREEEIACRELCTTVHVWFYDDEDPANPSKRVKLEIRRRFIQIFTSGIGNPFKPTKDWGEPEITLSQNEDCIGLPKKELERRRFNALFAEGKWTFEPKM